MKWFTSKFVALTIAAGCMLFANPAAWSFQIAELAAQQDQQDHADETHKDHTHDDPKAEKTGQKDEPVTDTSKLSGPENTVDSKFVRFHMWDGSIVGGEVTVDRIEVETEFGNLQIPVDKILKFYPGLNSIPALNERITELVAGLGDKNFDIRESSHRELVAMGIQLREEIKRFDDGGSAERKKHLDEIRKQIDSMVDEMDEFGEPTDERPLIRGDEIVTENFSIVGKILQKEFQLGSKFGVLTVELGDIRLGDRAFKEPKVDIRKTVEVSGTAFYQKQPVSTKIRVNRGDKISIRASGTVQWTNWNTSSGPDGLSNQGQWQGMNSGCLAARVGNSPSYIKIGSNGEFTAKQKGVLYLGVAIRDNYANNNGYRWDGGYTAKIVVKPASAD